MFDFYGQALLTVCLKINPGILVGIRKQSSICLEVAGALGTNRDQEMHAGTIVFKMAARITGDMRLREIRAATFA